MTKRRLILGHRNVPRRGPTNLVPKVHLPDGRTLRKRVSPHPFGGLLFTYEDVTDSLTLERSYNTLIEVQRRTLDNLYEGVALIGADGRLVADGWRPSPVGRRRPTIGEA